ncbi:ubiquinol-cytochrome c reductase iron-sulfur subunit [Natranaeroarchaeum sulfidigenes]|uniref:Rieske Fe-S protein n=1 Tax=Natranaeroarchaeum sulfidigenes TaxID=2784880 RepID=A0A897MLP8_9EURY|nr:ubiquinol-cytochrome c reductase iron-sulfur subunit [Natranaeroarchaeum sulfidigenes]QSG03120.1 Rieske Fe-S protein [Natranaeroarchaeum sulfidigenes]
MPDSDKYPVESGRRRFVKGVVGSAALSGIGVTTAVSVDSMTSETGEGGGPTVYRGNELVSGPAPRGMPQVPLEVDDEGYVRGIWPEAEEAEGPDDVATAEQEIGGVTYSTTWFQYCGSQTSPAVDPQEDRDNYFRYVGASQIDWQNEEVEGGDRVHIDDFADYEDYDTVVGDAGVGKPALVNWRSEELSPADRLPVLLIRSTNVEEAAQDNEWLDGSTDQGFIANLNQCTHYCCVPGFRVLGEARQFDAENMIYCNCHQSVYDPFSITEQQYVALPRPGDSVLPGDN